MSHQRVFTRQRFHQSLPVVVSAFLHIVVIAVLSVWLVPVIRRAGIWIDARADSLGLHEVENVSVRLDSVLEAPAPAPNVLSSAPDLLALDSLSDSLDDLLPLPAKKETPDEEHRDLVGDRGSLKRASSVEGAVDAITKAIRGELQNGDLTVAWLFDASHSLVDDRQRIAERLESFLSDTTGTSGHLRNTVVSFGARMKQRVATTDSRKRVVSSIKGIPIDPSGEERVLTAISQCVTRYSASNDKLMIVVWTDESGDDVKRLENVIELCRSKQVSVHVVGPSAVLGSDTGLHAYTDPKTDDEYLLPVTRGPDSAARERLRLGYWFLTRSPNRGVGRRGVQLPAWYGGHDLAGISSPFSPFALTRLAIETGGSFTILDNPDDRPPFELEAMSDYMPDYGSESEYFGELDRHPLRAAVMQAVEATRGQTELVLPPVLLFGERSELPPYPFEAPYLEPSQFERKLRTERSSLVRLAGRTARLVDQALLHVSEDGNIDRGLDELYDQEESPRWRAWYDLTRGRLLATNVRLEEYRLTCERLADGDVLAKTTNFIMLLADGSMKSGQEFRRRGEEAERLLRRCVREHGDTPWAYLAQRELDYALGIAIRQVNLRPGTASSRKQPSLPRF